MYRQGGNGCSGDERKLYTKSAASVRGSSKWRYSVQETPIALGLGAAPSMRLMKEKGEHHPSKTQATFPLFRLQPSRALLLEIYASLEL